MSISIENIYNFNRHGIFDAFVRIARKHGAKMPFYPMEEVICTEPTNILQSRQYNLNHVDDRQDLVYLFNHLVGTYASLDMPRQEQISFCETIMTTLNQLDACSELFTSKFICPDIILCGKTHDGYEHRPMRIEFTFNGYYYRFTSSDWNSYNGINYDIRDPDPVGDDDGDGYLQFDNGSAVMPEEETQLMVEKIQPDGKTIYISENSPTQGIDFNILDGFTWTLHNHLKPDFDPKDPTELIQSRHDAYVEAAEILWNNLISVKPTVHPYTINFKRA